MRLPLLLQQLRQQQRSHVGWFAAAQHTPQRQQGHSRSAEAQHQSCYQLQLLRSIRLLLLVLQFAAAETTTLLLLGERTKRKQGCMQQQQQQLH